MRTYRQLPDVPTGYPLDDVWSVVVPIGRTNEVLNPSFETNTTGYTAGAGSLARSTAQQYHGAYSGAYTPSAATTDGFYYGTITTTSGQIRAIHCKFRGQAGVPYALTFATTAGVDLIVKPFIATGRWQWIILYYTESSSTTRRIYFRKNGSTSVAVFYVDGVNSEVIQAGETASTHIDGDQLGLVPNQLPVAYYWTGTPHASTSVRSGLTRAGGMVIPFKKYGFLLTAIIGLGLAGVQNIATDYARIDGAYDDYTRKPPRQFTLTGRFQGRTYAELRRNRSALAQLFDRDLTSQDQRLTLLRHVEDEGGRIVSSTVRALVKYESGFSGNTDNQHAETVPITFTQYLPAIIGDGEAGAALTVQSSIASGANGMLQRSPAGVWSAMGTGITGGSAGAIAQGLDGKIYIGGTFTSISGVANTSKIAVWDPATQVWTPLGSGAAGGSVADLAVMPNGDIVAGGSFTSMGGVANTNRIAKWNGSAWSSISSGFTGTDITALAVSQSGILYAGGTFTVIGGTAAVNIASYNGSAWSALAGGVASTVYDMLTVHTSLYVSVDPSTVQRWDGSAWTVVGTVTGSVIALAADAAGNIYAGGGGFTAIGGVTALNVAKYNGVAWSPLGAGLSGGLVYTLFVDREGLLWAGGDFTSAGGITTPSGIARWNGSSWVYPDLLPGGTVQMRAGLSLPSGQRYLAITNNGTAIYGGMATVTNMGTARAYPTITIKGPTSGTARIYSLANATTGRAIYLNLTINAGETCTLIFQPDSLSFTSDFQDTIAGAILGGSNEADFFLQPGANTIALLSASSTVTATMQWRTAYASLDDVP